MPYPEHFTLILIDFLAAIGKVHQIMRCGTLIAGKVGSINLFHTTQLVPILISVGSGNRKRIFVY